MANLSVNIGGLELRNPVMTASGTFGYGEEFTPFIDIDRLGAYADVALDGLLDTAQTGTESAGHHVFERHLAICAVSAGDSSDSPHHRSRTAAVIAETLFFKTGMCGDETLDPFRTVLSADMNLTDGLEVIKRKKVGGSTRTEQKFRGIALSLQYFSEI